MAVYITLCSVWRVPDAVRGKERAQIDMIVLPGRYRMLEAENPFPYGDRIHTPYWLFDPSQQGFENTKAGFSKWYWEQWAHDAHGDRRVAIEIIAKATIVSETICETRVSKAA